MARDLRHWIHRVVHRGILHYAPHQLHADRGVLEGLRYEVCDDAGVQVS